MLLMAPSGASVMGEDGLLLITPEDIRKHNTEKSGSWLVIAGKVYDVESLSMQVRPLISIM